MNKEYEFREEAIPLVIFNEEKRIYELNEDAGDFLKQISAPIGIIAVAGMYRTGKSYLLNRMLLNRSGGFGVGPTINPCTKGMWVWGKPIQGFTPEGDPINVLVVDSEGLGALDEDSNHDVRIFSLAILLSSYFIYNSVGSIDENALQNLSLVINLTKHIHLKSTGITEDIDPEEYSQYFPSFMWVVRDFSLQLVDQEGEQITSKEYFEKALTQQKGFSDGVEQKNRIRRLLKSFFKERDCCTMIRPLTKEENLQILEKMQLEDLRPEFVDQVMQLRRKVINRIRPKMMHGKKLNGEMLYNLMLTHVDAINKGAVPNIESAWSYICKNECQKAQYDAYDKFEKSFQENFELQSPVFDDELKEIYSQAKKIALEDFGKVAVGEVQKQFLIELKDKLKQKFNQVRQQNEKLAEQQCLMFLQSNYTTIERKLKNQEYESIYDYVEELKSFQNYFNENGPPGPNRLTVLFEFCNKGLAEASEFFFKNVVNELNLQRQIGEEEKRKLHEELTEIKGEQRTKIDYLETKLRNSETEKAELSAKEQSMKENLTQLQKQSQQQEIELAEKLDTIKKESARQIEEFKSKFNQSEETSKEIHRQRISAESEFDKQKALLEQKLEFHEKSLEEAHKKEKELSNELKNIKRDHFNNSKDVTSKFEQQIKDLNKKIEEQNEQIFDWESKFQDLEQRYDQEQQKWDDQSQQLRKDLQKTKDQYIELTKSNDILKKKYSEEVEQLKSGSEDDKNSMSQRIQELEQSLKYSEDQLEISRLKWEKDLAIYKQKQEFLEHSLLEERKKNEEQRQAHDQMIRNIQSRERDSVIGKEEAAKRVNEIKLQHGQEYHELEQKFDLVRVRMQSQIDQLQERNSELELSLKIQVGDFEKEIQSLREQLQSAEEKKSRALDQVKSLDSQKLRLMEESEERYKQRQGELESEIEEKTLSFEEQIRDLQIRSEEQLGQLKIFYESEKERLERRLIDDKDRAQKRYNNMVEDYEQKLKEEQQNHEDDVAMVQDEKHQIETQQQEIINQLDHDNSLKDQQIESLSRYLAETKESLNKIQSMNTSAIEQQLDKFNEERRELIAKIEKLTIELTRKERTITTLENQKETLATQVQQKEKAILEMRQEVNSEKNDLGDKIEQMRTKHQTTTDELLQEKINLERDRALKQQQLLFQEQRINDLTKQLEDTIRKYEERIKQDREDLQRDAQEKVARVTAEKEAAEAKYDVKRKALKELETNVNKQNNLSEREKAVMLEKYQNLEVQQKDLIKNYESEIVKLRETNEQLNMALSSDKQAIQEEVEKWRREYVEMEKQHSELANTFDREKALFEGKFKFLEQQRDTAKKDFEDAQNKFQATVEQLQRSQSESKNKAEATYQIALSSQETKFNQRIKEIQESQSILIQELQQKNKQLERDNKLMNEKIEMTNKSKQYEQGSLEKKLEKSLENEARLQDELEQVKAERDSKISEYQRMLDKEKEAYKQKLRDTEGKGTSVQAKQTELMLNFEKERAKWDHEKSYIINQKDDAVENAQRLEKKVELLTRENEKLKNDVRANRKNMYQAAANTSTYQSAVVGQKILGSLGGFGMNKFGKDGGTTERTTYSKDIGSLSQSVHIEKSFGASTGGGFQASSGGGAVSGIPNLDTSFKNILSTPSSNRSEGKSGSTFSPDARTDK